jgi:hypothetical protein
MPLSGAAYRRPLMINLVSRRGHRQILLATSSRHKRSVSAAHVRFQATRRRNLRLGCDFLSVSAIFFDFLSVSAIFMPDMPEM